jgi:hypothetical protein
LSLSVFLRGQQSWLHYPKSMSGVVSSFLQERAWYGWLGIILAIVALLHGLIALLPPSIDDALKLYLVWSKIIAVSHKLELQPFVHPFYALLPLQVEMHWAALFAIANESAVTVWDYFCALSFLAGIGLFAWFLTSSRRVALVAALMMLSTPAFYAMMGGGKVDNASAQYGIAAFLWVALWPTVGIRASVLAGLCLGWAVASRYTNVIMLPGLILFAVLILRSHWAAASAHLAPMQSKRYFFVSAVLCGLAAAFAGAPMLVKNWLLVGCPLAPQVGCDAASWSDIYRVHTAHLQNITLRDFFLYPFVWTFSSRDSMLGNISPLFLGFAPFLAASRKSNLVQSAALAGLAGLASVATWFVIEPLVLFTRFLLIPLAVLTIPLSAGIVAAEQDFRLIPARWLIRGAIALVLIFLLFESRAVVYAGRYVTALDSRAARYHTAPGYDVAVWLNTHVQSGERVAIGNFGGYKYFVEPRLLLSTESAEEFQWLWEHGRWSYAGSGSITPKVWLASFWSYYLERGFTYVVVAKDRMEDALSAWPSDLHTARPKVVIEGSESVVLKIEKP